MLNKHKLQCDCAEKSDKSIQCTVKDVKVLNNFNVRYLFNFDQKFKLRLRYNYKSAFTMT